MARQTDDTDIVSQIFTAELSAQANILSGGQYLFLQLHVAESTATLAEFSDELRGYSTLITAAERLARLHLIKPVTLFFKIFSKTMKNNLTGNKPSLLLLNIYKLGMFCSLKSRKRQP